MIHCLSSPLLFCTYQSSKTSVTPNVQYLSTEWVQLTHQEAQEPISAIVLGQTPQIRVSEQLLTHCHRARSTLRQEIGGGVQVLVY